jgi:hypothetical protein
MNLSESYKNRLSELAGIQWLPKTLYHFTPTKNVKSIMKNGLIPKYKPNRKYYSDKFTSNAVYLTDVPLINSVNLPSDLDYEEKITILKINTSFLDISLFVVDDDYYDLYLQDDESIEDMGEEIKSSERLLDSLKKETGVAYQGIIPVKAISIFKSYDYSDCPPNC